VGSEVRNIRNAVYTNIMALDTKNVDKVFREAVKENFISKKDEKLFKYCLLILKNGWKKHEEIKKFLKLKRKADKWFNNLKKNGYFARNGKIYFDTEYPDVEFALMMNVAEGYIERKAG